MRSGAVTKRKISPDFKFNSATVAKFINYLMERGKKSVAERIFYRSMEIISEKTKQNPLDIFDQAMKNVSPVVEVKSRRIGGATYQVPIEVREGRRFALASRWVLGAANHRRGKPMAEKLAAELIDASQNQGEAMKKKEDMHRMAEANRAFAHFA